MTVYYSQRLSTAQWNKLTLRKFRNDRDAEKAARTICLAVKRRGNAAVRTYSLRFDGSAPPLKPVSNTALRTASGNLAPEFSRALKIAASNIARFHKRQILSRQSITTMPGVTCWRTSTPVPRVGLYIPAGSAPLPSTVLMLGIPARLAGCDSIALFSPPTPEGFVNPLILAAASVAGITEVYAVGGAQAIAAMAYGTESIPKVDKIFGPGNIYVNKAKRFISSDPDGCAIDMPAGPSELLVIADRSANPACIAADLLSQAEHDPNARVALVSTSESLVNRVMAEIAASLKYLPRQGIIRKSLAEAFILIVPSLAEAVRFANAYAPEHLSIQTVRPRQLAANVANAGSVFLGNFSPVAAGDYASGTNHTLPTGGSARAYSGLTLESFQKTVTFQSLTRSGLARISDAVRTLAAAEGLEAHRQAVTVRGRR